MPPPEKRPLSVVDGNNGNVGPAHKKQQNARPFDVTKGAVDASRHLPTAASFTYGDSRGAARGSSAGSGSYLPASPSFTSSQSFSSSAGLQGSQSSASSYGVHTGPRASGGSYGTNGYSSSSVNSSKPRPFKLPQPTPRARASWASEDDLDLIDLTQPDDIAGVPRTTSTPNGRASRKGKDDLELIDLTQSDDIAEAPRTIPTARDRASWADEDGLELIDLTQSDDIGNFQLYGTLDVSIVGVRYYDGVVTPGEVVCCKREPGNPYDSNAVRVNSVLGNQVGHLPRKVVEKLAPYMDKNEIRVEAIITGEKGFYDCPARLSLYGTCEPSARAQLELRLKTDRLVKASQLKQTKREAEIRRQAATLGLKGAHSSTGLGPGDSVPESHRPPSMDELVNISQAVDVRQVGTSIRQMVMSEDELAKMPKAEQPDILAAQLLPYQLQGLAWMISQENPQFPAPAKDGTSTIQLWRRERSGGYTNVACNYRSKMPPRLLSGGILADDMGLGKTLQIISLIVMNRGANPGPTLIVAPVSVMSNWEQQIERHVKKEHALRVLRYHGPSTGKLRRESLSDYDVVITSYGKIMAEGGNASHLVQQHWRRVVLDEGHTIRNARTKIARGACLLKAQSRWVVTGTPIINTVKDLQSLLQFLDITGGLENPTIFDHVITRPLNLGDPRAESFLQSLMKDLCLRRRKDMKFIDLKLPPKTEYIHQVTFHPNEQVKYDALLAEAQGSLERYQHENSNNDNRRKKTPGVSFTHVLERLLRLRQMCNHWTLCRQRITDLMESIKDADVVALTPENKRILQEALQLYVENQEDCAVCLDTMKDPVITHCKHVFCRSCISRVINTQHKCPMCRNELAEEQLLEPAPEGLADDGQEGDPNGDVEFEYKSSKTEALLQIVGATLRRPVSKVVIFSQWTSFLNVVQHQIAEAGYKYTRIDGTMKPAERDAALETLDKDDETRILLASLGVCSVGLNLVAADTVILSDSWWAPAIEDQAVDRVHRLGQTRPTTVWRLVVEQTVEERVLDIQKEKRELVSQAFQEAVKGQKQTKTRVGDIMRLLS